jgi:S-adenosylmethionine:tRNA ribosyltransferase-isomerase
MDIEIFDYYLPDNLIAQKPSNPRDLARLLVMNKENGTLQDDNFFHLDNWLKEGDILVLNKTKVIPARILFEINHKWAEILLVNRTEDGFWKAMVRPGKLFKEGNVIKVKEVEVKVIGVDQDGLRILDFGMDEQQMTAFLDINGRLPVPPYIKGESYQEEEYNTVFSDSGTSIAAPTAGLHFTQDLLYRLQSKGIILEYVNLNVGLGTFLPVKVKDTRNHKMHKESYDINFSTAKRLNNYVGQGKRIIAVGTTSVRVLEDNMGRYGHIKSGHFETDIFITPGYEWKIVDGLITNFHLPKSTLLMLVSAFAGKENIRKAYEHAVARQYKFFSFGDAMLII